MKGKKKREDTELNNVVVQLRKTEKIDSERERETSRFSGYSWHSQNVCIVIGSSLEHWALAHCGDFPYCTFPFWMHFNRMHSRQWYRLGFMNMNNLWKHSQLDSIVHGFSFTCIFNELQLKTETKCTESHRLSSFTVVFFSTDIWH